MLNEVQEHILQIVADMKGTGEGAVNIRSDGQKAFRRNSEHITIESKPIRTASTSALRRAQSTNPCTFPWF